MGAAQLSPKMVSLDDAEARMGAVARHRKPRPPWLLGLLIAIAIFAIGLILFSALGYGDDPVIDPNAAASFVALPTL